jgi:hypothetical protein
VSPEEVTAIYENLRDDICVCGAVKQTGKSFCKHHYFALPAPMRDRLYVRTNYCESFLAAARHLRLSPPAPTYAKD